MEEPTEEVGETTQNKWKNRRRKKKRAEGKKLDQLEEPTEEVGETTPEQVEEMPKEGRNR
ncbi:hypothetical protein ACT7DH_04755 [Bacillus pacificus]